MTLDKLRVAAAQFASTADVEENLATCLRMLDNAAETGADLVVFGEFANHISVYENDAHCRSVAVGLDGPWLGEVRSRTAHHGLHLTITVTVPRPDDRVTVTNVMIGPDGSIVSTADKQTLMGNERAFLSGGFEANPVADTPFGPVGMYSCMDGVTFETPRGFAVRGARLLTNSLNSFALDEAALHIPVRAVENGVFVVAANKIGPLLPADQVEAFSRQLGVPAEALDGAGESQIVDPDGNVLARASRSTEEVIAADVDLSLADRARRRLAGRRPELYDDLAKPDSAVPGDTVPERVSAVCLPGALAEPALVDRVSAESVDLVVLPEGSPVPKNVGPGVHIVTTTFVDGHHVGQVWTDAGLVHEQDQLHQADRLADVTDLGDELTTYVTPWGDLAIVIGDDHRYPEVFRLAAIRGAHVIAVCYRPEHRWEVELALVERAAENRLCVAACAPTGSPVGGTMVLNPPRDSLWSPKRSAPYDGTINTPEAVIAAADELRLDAELFPRRATNREVSRDTDLVAGRSWQASSVLVE